MPESILSKKKITFYPSEFKAEAVKLALESTRPVTQIARELGVNENTLHTWLSNHLKPGHKNSGSATEHEATIRQLRQELARVTQERDLLKKAAAYFAKESR